MSAPHVLGYGLVDPSALPGALASEASKILMTIGLSLAALSVLDVLWVRFSWLRRLRMTRQEVKEEHRQSEGDPALRARRLHIARERLRRQIAKSVPKATLVVANPTHFAVALRYVAGETTAPLVLAKGVDATALRIREIAERHHIPVIENPTLARALYSAVDIDAAIPREFYRAIAEIIIFLSSKGRKRPGPARSPRGKPVT